jgi:hypothetical protein
MTTWSQTVHTSTRSNNMEWYWWVLLGVVIVVGGTVKLKVLNMWMEKRKANQERIEEDA